MRAAGSRRRALPTQQKGVLVLGKSLTIAAMAGVLASGLAAIPAQAGTSAQAAHQHDAASAAVPHPLLPAASHLSAVQQAMLSARAHWLSEHAAVRQRAAIAADLRSAVAAAGRADGVLTGIVRGLDGRPVAGACITATGPSGPVLARSRANGRYLLPGLRSGRYSVSISNCASSASSRTYVWPLLPASVALGTGQRKALPAATAIPANGAAAVARSTASASQSGTGGISGRVTGRSHPLKGICATAERVGGGQGEGALTSQAGKYHIRGLKPGRYQVEFSTDFGTCGNRGNWLDQWYPGITTPFPAPKAAKIRVRAGRTMAGINARLKLGGEIGGTTRTRHGRRIKNICVEVQGRIRGGGIDIGLVSGRDGRYAVHGLFPGRYTVAFSTICTDSFVSQWWRLRTSQAHATSITIKGSKIARHIDAALDRGATITGTVRAVNSSGRRLAGICVSADGPHGDSASAFTRKDGTYRLPGLYGGRYVVVFDPGCSEENPLNFLPQHRRVTVQRPHTRTGVNAYLKRGAGFSGVVKGPHGHPLEGVCVQEVGEHGNGFAETDFDGTYAFGGLQPGSYVVQFMGCDNQGSVAPQYYNNESDSGSADPITLTTGKVTRGINATMKPGAIIRGLVTDSSGKPLSNVCVGVADQSLVNFGDVFDAIDFTRAGKYRAVNLAPGQYQVSFGCASGGKYVSHWYRAKSQTEFPGLLSIPSGLTSGINAVMRPGGSVSGLVTNKAGHQARNTCLYLVNAKTGLQVLSSVFDGFVDHGRYKITGLAAGAYKVFFYGCGIATNYASQWYHGRATERAADPVRVRPSHLTAGINAVMTTGGTISGQVVARATGKPVRNECVDAYDSATQASGFAQTDKTGHYTMRGLATGRYLLFFSRCFRKGPNVISFTRPGLVSVKAPHATTGIITRLAPGGNVSGTVSAGMPPKPQIGTCVELAPLDPDGAYGFGQTGTDGTYTATGLAAGKYQVYFNDPFCLFGVPSLASQWYSGQPTQATADVVTVTTGGTTTGIDATLQPFGTITGTVTGPGQAAVSGECVTAVPVGKDFAGFFPPEIAITTATGSYSLLEVQPGRYKLKFSTGCGDSGFKTQWWQNATSRATATVITVGAGAAVTGIDAVLTR